MKSRISFVSNSSSTSYIISFKNNDKCQCCGRSDPDFSDMIESVADHSCSERTHLESRGFDNVIQQIEGEWPEYGYRDPKPTIEKMAKFMSDHEDWKFIYCSVSYHDEIINDMLREKEANGTLVKIWSDHED